MRVGTVCALPERRMMSLRLTSLSLLLLSAGCTTFGTRAPEAPTPAGSRALEPTWHVVGGYSTTFDPQRTDRSHNIGKAATRVDGALIPAGGTWSFNKRVGERTLDGGWRLAPALDVEGANPSVGGGICQVSSTVYNALLLGDLRVRQRFPHSRPVRYIPLGRDATVSWGDKDLVVRNPHPFPVRLRTRIVRARLLVQLLAPARLGYEVRLETADSEPAAPRKELQILESPNRLAVGGVWIKLYRHRVRRGSTYETERVGRSSFYPYRIAEETRP